MKGYKNVVTGSDDMNLLKKWKYWSPVFNIIVVQTEYVLDLKLLARYIQTTDTYDQ